MTGLVIDIQSQHEQDPGCAWMLALQQGDDSAFREIVHYYGRRIVAFFRRAGADRDAAEDLCQEVFLRVHRARDRYRPTARFSTWIHRIASRIAINEATRNRWRRAVSLDGGDDGGAAFEDFAAGGDGDPSRELTLEEERERVRAAVASLPSTQRTALILNRFQGLSYEEVGEVLGLRIPAVKSLLFRARDGLKKRLALDESEAHDAS